MLLAKLVDITHRYSHVAGYSGTYDDVMQVVWATSRHIGCGATRCAEISPYTDALFFVCNFGPS